VVQDVVLSVLSLGSLTLWRQLAKGEFDSNLWVHLAKVAEQHARLVRSLVSRFHVAMWTALHLVHGLLSLRHLLPRAHRPAAKAAETLDAIWNQHQDVVGAFESSTASSFQKVSEQGLDLFRRMTQDPGKLDAFGQFGSLPQEERLERMSEMLLQLDSQPVDHHPETEPRRRPSHLDDGASAQRGHPRLCGQGLQSATPAVLSAVTERVEDDTQAHATLASESAGRSHDATCPRTREPPAPDESVGSGSVAGPYSLDLLD